MQTEYWDAVVKPKASRSKAGFDFSSPAPVLARAYEQTVTVGGRQTVVDWRGRAKN